MYRYVLSLSLLGAGLVGACFQVDQIEDGECPDLGTELTYENFGAAFIGDYCQGCHAASAADREGAPTDLDFDTIDDIRQNASRIYGRSAMDNTSMPPGPSDPTQAERYQLGEWLVCGAP